METVLATRAADVAGADLIVLPGSKSTMADLAWLRASGHTVFTRSKTTVRVRARAGAGPFAGAAGDPLSGYEIHSGRTVPCGPGSSPLLTIVQRGADASDEPDGALDARGSVAGTYVHGLLADGRARRALLRWLADRAGQPALPTWGSRPSPAVRYDRLADAIAAALDLGAIARLVGLAA